jgi:hypothetical protein
LSLASALAACGGKSQDDYYPDDGWNPNEQVLNPDQADSDDRLLSNGFSLFSGKDTTGGKSGIGVNAHLWRATLDTLAFMPLTSVDSQGGVIITDWYTNPNVAGERFKMNVYILDTQLRADGVKVSVFRQTKTKDGWMDASVNPETAIQLENQILRRARELKLDSE